MGNDEGVVRKQQRYYSNGIMWFITPLLDFIIHILFFFIISLFLVIGLTWCLIESIYRKSICNYQKIFRYKN